MEFVPWPSISRLNKDAIYTEKINGTNAAVVVEPYTTDTDKSKAVDVVSLDGDLYGIWAQSRKRFITPGDDNFAFALWVYDNAPALVKTLGVGRHFGEWWGKGIQGGYGLNDSRRFSLFNVKRWEEVLHWDYGHKDVKELYMVPVLDKSRFSTATALMLVERLRIHGSYASLGFMEPEGVVVFHTASQTPYKTFLENDDIPKSLQEGHK